MSRPSEERMLAFLRGDVGPDEREEILTAVEQSPELQRELHLAAIGLAAAETVRESLVAPGRASTAPGASGGSAAPKPGGRRVPAWWVPAAAAASLALAIPGTISVLGDGTELPTTLAGAPVSPDPSYVFVLHGRWPDATTIDAQERSRRADQYWAWTSELSRRGVLLAAGDLLWEPGERLGPGGGVMSVAAAEIADPDFIVGTIAVRTATYEEALAIARDCPHLAYGGRVSVRRVGAGFVTVPGAGDWSD